MLRSRVASCRRDGKRNRPAWLAMQWSASSARQLPLSLPAGSCIAPAATLLSLKRTISWSAAGLAAKIFESGLFASCHQCRSPDTATGDA